MGQVVLLDGQVARPPRPGDCTCLWCCRRRQGHPWVRLACAIALTAATTTLAVWSGGAAEHTGVGYAGAVVGGVALAATLAAGWVLVALAGTAHRGLHRVRPRATQWPPPGFAAYGREP